MERLVDDFAKASQSLKVHKRAAGNVKEQLSIILKSLEREDSDHASLQALRISLNASTPKLQALSELSSLESYLKQGEITNALDSVFDSCWAFASVCEDELLREDIEAQREIYDSDRKADSVNLRRLLRECLRRNDMQQLLILLTGSELAALQSAVKLEISMSGTNSETIHLYNDFLSQLDLEPARARNARGLQDLTGKIVRISSTPIAWGAACSVWTGELYGKRVTLHSPRSTVNNLAIDDIAVLKKSIVWASFDHSHVLRLLGIYRNFDRSSITLVSPWMENQTASDYVRNNPGADRLKLITEIASGLVYLHSRTPPYVHGLLTASGVLVNEEKSAVVGGFASATFERGWMTPLRWLAPENATATSEKFVPSLSSDVYSFAMTALEIMTGKYPFEEVRSPVQVLELLRMGTRPAHPEHRLIHHGLDDKLWTLITRCWAQDPRVRPPMAEVLQELEKMRELPALNVRDLTGLVTLVEGGLNTVIACGAFGDIRLATLTGFGPVALKTLNIKNHAQQRPVLHLTKRFIREATIWSRMKHPNILSFFGTADPPGLTTCLVSPWMPNGNCIEYLLKHRDVSPKPIAQGIARGLSYLHAQDPPAVHGDLRGPNVLVSDAGEPLLCDFGLAVIVEDLTHMPISTSMRDCGNPRWMAPELFMGEDSIVSTESDVWALGMVLLEITTLEVPFCELKNSAQVIMCVHTGGRPTRRLDKGVVDRGLNDDLWALMQRCWAEAPSERPLASQVLRALETLNDSDSRMGKSLSESAVSEE